MPPTRAAARKTISEEQEPPHARAIRLLDHVGLDRQVLKHELRGIGIVGVDAPDPGGGQEDDLRGTGAAARPCDTPPRSRWSGSPGSETRTPRDRYCWRGCPRPGRRPGRRSPRNRSRRTPVRYASSITLVWIARF